QESPHPTSAGNRRPAGGRIRDALVNEPANNVVACPSYEALNRFCTMPADNSVQAHLRQCTSCRQIVDQIQADGLFLDRFRARLSVSGCSKPAIGPFDVPEIPGYEQLRELHRGGQGTVYQARQRSTGQSVAIKIIRGGASDRARFDREV